MSGSIFSPLWYRVADLKPQLRTHVVSHRHDYRGLIWYILEDKSSGRNHRFSATAYQFVGLMDGNRSVDVIWELLNERLGDFSPSQNELITLLSKLHGSDLLQCDVPPDTTELFQRHQRQKSQSFKQRFQNPLSQKLPMWDPEDFLQNQLPKVAWLFRWQTGIIWLATIIVAGMLAGIHWGELTHDALNHSLSPNNIVILCVIYPLIKLLHEFGHAFAAKLEGGEIHEMGIMFLVFMPIPYVNVSTAATFRVKEKRMLVSAAGIMVELFLAACALFIWLIVQPGLVREIAFNVALIGSVSSVFFNGNPLLRYDGYYVLADAIGIPNLYQRSTKYMVYLCQRYLVGIPDISSPASAPGEASWFIAYSTSSFIFRMTILWFIITFIIDKFLILGVLLALWLVGFQVIKPIIKGISYLAINPDIQRRRTRAISVCGGVIVLFLVLIFVLPSPLTTRAEGVVSLPDNSQIRAATDGFIGELVAAPNGEINANSPILTIKDPILDATVKSLQYKVKELEVQFRANWTTDKVKAAIVKDELHKVRAELAHALDQQHAMIVRGNKRGHLLIPSDTDLPGRFIKKGELIGYIVDDTLPTAQIVVSQDNIELVNDKTLAVDIRLATNIGHTIPAKIIRWVPEATNKLPSDVLATTGGGSLVVDPSQPDGLTTLEKFFQVEIEFPADEHKALLGARVYARFNHGSEPIAYRWFRSIRQLFLRQFSV